MIHDWFTYKLTHDLLAAMLPELRMEAAKI